MRKVTEKHRKNSGDGRARSRANLKPWPKGVSGNPNGRPKSITLSDAYRRILAEPVPGDPAGRTYADVIAEMVAMSATAGSVKAARELADRTEGKPRQVLEHSLQIEARRKTVVEQMFLKLIAQGIPDADARAQLLVLGVSEDDLGAL